MTLQGGAVYAGNGASLTVLGCEFSENTDPSTGSYRGGDDIAVSKADDHESAVLNSVFNTSGVERVMYGDRSWLQKCSTSACGNNTACQDATYSGTSWSTTCSCAAGEQLMLTPERGCAAPTGSPTAAPTTTPTAEPTVAPTTAAPSSSPTTTAPTDAPSSSPSTAAPYDAPAYPTINIAPSLYFPTTYQKS